MSCGPPHPCTSRAEDPRSRRGPRRSGSGAGAPGSRRTACAPPRPPRCRTPSAPGSARADASRRRWPSCIRARSRVVSISRMADLPTPLEEAPPGLAEGRPLFLKREDVHELGAFKWRGALPALEAFRARGADGVVTASTGNHGAASAWAAQRMGMRAVVFVPEEASEAKLGLLEQLGAELHRVGEDLDESKDLAREHATANDLPFFEDGAEPAQFDGYEAIGEEIVQQLGRAPATVIVPVGNGALIIGVFRG